MEIQKTRPMLHETSLNNPERVNNPIRFIWNPFPLPIFAKLPDIMMQFGVFNHHFSSYNAAVRFPATKVCSAISASNSAQQASSCA